MRCFEYKEKKYRIDEMGFLLFPEDWDEDFAVGMAEQQNIEGGLTEQHWRVINFIRDNFERMNDCPLVYVACKNNDLGLGDLKALFPRGYLRGACKIAGVTYRAGQMQVNWIEENIVHHQKEYDKKLYMVDAQGFLVNHEDWDENFAVHRAHHLGMRENLSKRHWDVISFLRNYYKKNHEVPNIYETCGANDLTLQELEQLFPTGYHRGAVNIAGLRVLEENIR